MVLQWFKILRWSMIDQYHSLFASIVTFLRVVVASIQNIDALFPAPTRDIRVKVNIPSAKETLAR
jgi:hypothetical protein